GSNPLFHPGPIPALNLKAGIFFDIMKRIRVYAGITLAMLFWSLSFVGYKVAYKYFEPMALIFFRMVISAIFLTLIIKLTGAAQKINRKDYGQFLLMALFEPLLYFLGESYGMKLVTPTTGAVIVSTIPLLTPIAAWLIFREKVSWSKVAGIVVSFTGVLLVLLGKDLSLIASPTGVALMMVAVLSAVSYSLIIAKLAVKYKPLTIVQIQSVLGAILFLPIFLLTDLKVTLQIHLSWEAILPLLFLALFPSSLSFIFFTGAVREIGITRSNVFTYFIPVFTAIFSFFIWGETFTGTKLLGIPVVLTGLILAQLNLKKKRLPEV
ncbi:MAG: DMT family transporter, partial [Bacteroidia bacterium]|nr:DMT family transporter [Bacteroidia bacterium]